TSGLVGNDRVARNGDIRFGRNKIRPPNISERSAERGAVNKRQGVGSRRQSVDQGRYSLTTGVADSRHLAVDSNGRIRHRSSGSVLELSNDRVRGRNGPVAGRRADGPDKRSV